MKIIFSGANHSLLQFSVEVYLIFDRLLFRFHRRDSLIYYGPHTDSFKSQGTRLQGGPTGKQIEPDRDCASDKARMEDCRWALHRDVVWSYKPLPTLEPQKGNYSE